MRWSFQPGRQYSRVADIHGPYGGQRQSGISTPAGQPVIFLFTGDSGTQHGYADEFLADGSFRFTGMGQVGDMAMASGNKAVRDHASNGKDLLVFRAHGKGRPVTFVDAFTCVGWEYQTQPDTNGQARQAIVFTLMPIDSVIARLETDVPQPAPSAAGSVADLRAKALQAAKPGGGGSEKVRPATVFERSAVVRDYVLARAAGECEGCQTAAPFKTTQGAPFLEVHHIRRLTDGGPDDPRFMAAVCPNCHRRAHYGADRLAFNDALQTYVTQRESV